MTIRFAELADAAIICAALAAKNFDYNTPADAEKDLAAHRLIVATDGNGKILGSVAIVKKAHRGYTAIMRMCVYEEGKGVASALIDFILELDIEVLGATPWDDNPAMIHIFVKRGFVFQYQFNDHYCFYKREI